MLIKYIKLKWSKKINMELFIKNQGENEIFMNYRFKIKVKKRKKFFKFANMKGLVQGTKIYIYYILGKFF